MPPFRFYLITPGQTDAQAKTLALLPQLLQAGLKGLQVREKQLTPIQLQRYCADIQSIVSQRALDTNTPGSACCCLINQPLAAEPDEPTTLLPEGAGWGLHLSEAQLRNAEGYPPACAAPNRWVGASTHSLQSVLHAQARGLDFVVFGPVYATPSKVRYGNPLGLEALAQVCANTTIPVFALGGMTPQRVALCRDAGAYGVGAMGALWNAPRPVQALEAFAQALGGF